MKTIPVEDVARSDAKQNAQGDEPCLLCGKDTNGSRFVHLATWGDLVPADAELSEDEDQGWFPVGPECARKLPADFVAVNLA